MAQRKAEPYLVDCPLCDNAARVAKTGDLCSHCGAMLTVFDTPTDANQYAERMKAQDENVRWRQVQNGPYWVVAHKATPSNTRYGTSGYESG